MTRQNPVPKKYYVQNGSQELGPLTLAELNRLRSTNKISATDPCREANAAEYRPLGEMFPHLGEFVHKPKEQLRQEARELEGNMVANSALVCSLLSWVIFSYIFGAFAIVLGLKSFLYARRLTGFYSVVIAAFPFVRGVLRLFGVELFPSQE